MTMVKVWFKLPGEQAIDWISAAEKSITFELKNVKTVSEVKILEPIHNRDVGYFGKSAIGYVEVHITGRQKVVDYLVEELGAEPLFVW